MVNMDVGSNVRFSADLVRVDTDGENRFFWYRLRAWWDDRGGTTATRRHGVLLFEDKMMTVGLASHDELVERVRWRVDRLREWQSLVDAASVEGVL